MTNVSLHNFKREPLIQFTNPNEPTQVWQTFQTVECKHERDVSFDKSKRLDVSKLHAITFHHLDGPTTVHLPCIVTSNNNNDSAVQLDRLVTRWLYIESSSSVELIPFDQLDQSDQSITLSSKSEVSLILVPTDCTDALTKRQSCTSKLEIPWSSIHIHLQIQQLVDQKGQSNVLCSSVGTENKSTFAQVHQSVACILTEPWDIQRSSALKQYFEQKHKLDMSVISSPLDSIVGRFINALESLLDKQQEQEDNSQVRCALITDQIVPSVDLQQMYCADESIIQLDADLSNDDLVSIQSIQRYKKTKQWLQTGSNNHSVPSLSLTVNQCRELHDWLIECKSSSVPTDLCNLLKQFFESNSEPIICMPPPFIHQPVKSLYALPSTSQLKSARLSVILVIDKHTVQSKLDCAIESILNQTYLNLELVIVLSSQVGTSVIQQVRRYAQQYPDKIHLLDTHNNNMSMFECQSVGLATSTGSYVSFHDPGHTSQLNRYAQQMTILLLLSTKYSSVLCESNDVQLHVNETRVYRKSALSKHKTPTSVCNRFKDCCVYWTKGLVNDQHEQYTIRQVLVTVQ